jgi:hypothetical protein
LQFMLKYFKSNLHGLAWHAHQSLLLWTNLLEHRIKHKRISVYLSQSTNNSDNLYLILVGCIFTCISLVCHLYLTCTPLVFYLYLTCVLLVLKLYLTCIPLVFYSYLTCICICICTCICICISELGAYPGG